MTDNKSLEKLHNIIELILAAETDNIQHLTAIAGLNLAEDFAEADLSNTNLSAIDLIEADFRGA